MDNELDNAVDEAVADLRADLRADQAVLNITWSGYNGEMPDPVSYDATDVDLKQMVSEAVRTGYVPGIDADVNVDLTDFVVDRFAAKDDQPNRIFVRPKVPFGTDRVQAYIVVLDKDTRDDDAEPILNSRASCP